MKNLLGLFLSFVFLFSISTFSFAQEESGVLSPTPTPDVVYALAYPGILPDNPLYFLKAARDRIIGFLINDTLKKAEFNLLTSDKRLYAATLLLEKDKEDLAITTLSKSNNYLDEAIANTKLAASQGKNVDTVLSNLKNGILKREEMLSDIEKELESSFQTRLAVELERVLSFKNTINDISSN